MANGDGSANIGRLRVYLDRVSKLIPAELTGAYIAVQAYLGVPDDPRGNVPILIGVGLFLTVLVAPYLVVFRRVDWRRRSDLLRIIVSTISLPILAINISITYVAIWLSDHVNTESNPNWLKLPALILVCWALLTPLLLRDEKK
jgi:hypothetical protein